jgi:hypothetical protein
MRKLARRLLLTALPLAFMATLFTAAPAGAQSAVEYLGVAESSPFSCWRAPSGNNYCASIRSSIVQEGTFEIAYRVNIWCTVNGNPSNCQITWGGGLKRFRADLDPGFATYPWGTATRQTGGGSSQVIWEGAFHDISTDTDYVYQTVGSVNVRWTAPGQLSSTKTRCSDAMRTDDRGVSFYLSFSGPLNCM